jgi:DNA polymerase-4
MFLQQLPIDALWGVGPVTAARLRSIGLDRVVDVRSAVPARLRETIGSHADWLVQLAHGIDERAVEPNRPRKSVGTERTFVDDVTDIAVIRDEVAGMAREDADWLERHVQYARTLTLKVRYNDFTTITRSHTRTPAERDADALAARAVALLDRTDAGRRPVRLLGVALHGLTDEPVGPPIIEPRPRLPFGDESEEGSQ